MRRKCLSLLSVLMVLFSMFFVSCANESSGSGSSASSKKAPTTRDSSVVGKWLDDAGSGTWFQFNADGTFSMYDSTNGTVVDSTMAGGPSVCCWYTSGNKLGLYPDDIVGTTFTYSISGGKLYLEGAPFTKQ